MQWIGSTAVETDFRCRQRKRQREPQMGTDGTRRSHAGVIPACNTEPAQENPWEAEQQNAHYRVPRKRDTRSVIFTLDHSKKKTASPPVSADISPREYVRRSGQSGAILH